MNVSPILQHFSHDGGGFPLAAKHQFKPGPLGAWDLLAEKGFPFHTLNHIAQ